MVGCHISPKSGGIPNQGTSFIPHLSRLYPELLIDGVIVILPHICGNFYLLLPEPCPTLWAGKLEPDQALGQALRRLRTARKWSQTDLALRADVDRNYISLIELGKNSPSVRMLFRICEAFDIAPSEFLRDVERRVQSQSAR